MPMAIGSGAWLSTDTAGTVYTISGLAFQPKALLLYTMGLNSATDTTSSATNQALCLGCAASPSDRRAMGVLGVDAASSADTQEIYRADAVLCFPTAAGAVDGLLDLGSVTTDGFTLVVDDQLSFSIRYFWIAWGGAGIDHVTTGAIQEPGATGVVSYTVGAGVRPTVVIFGGCQLTAAAPTVAQIDGGFMIGAASSTGASNQFVAAINSDEGSASMDVDSYLRFDECLAMITVAGGNPNARASFNGFDAQGFDLNWTARASTRQFLYLAMDAGTGVKVGKATIDLTTIGNTTTVSGLTFRPDGGLIVGMARGEDSAGVAWSGTDLSIGAFTGPTTRFAHGMKDVDAAADSLLSLGLSYDEVYLTTTTVAEVDLDVMTADGFRLIVDDTLGSAIDLAYVAFGDGWTPTWLPPRGSLRQGVRHRRR